jgi:hypothetical protein
MPPLAFYALFGPGVVSRKVLHKSAHALKGRGFIAPQSIPQDLGFSP